MSRTLLFLLTLTLLASLAAAAQEKDPAPQKDPAPSASNPAAEDYSGMYSFLRDGEFLQLTVEAQNKISGIISRYGDLDSDKGAFLAQFFKDAKLNGHELSFTTEKVHGVWFEFKGTVDRGPGKSLAEEAYYEMKGTLTQSATDTDSKVTAKARAVVFKSFPQDAAPAPPAKRN